MFEIELGRLGLGRIILVGIVHLLHIRMTIEGVGIDIHFGIEGDDLILLGDDEGIDLDQRAVVIDEKFVQAGQDLAERLLQLLFDLQPEQHLVEVIAFDPGQGIDVNLDNPLGGLFRDLLDIHTTVLTGHNGDGGRVPVRDDGEVEFFLDIDALLHQNLAHQSSFRPRLLGHQGHAQYVARRLGNLFRCPAELHPAAFSTTAGMNLRFYGHGQTEFFGNFLYFCHAVCNPSRGYRYTVFSEQFFCLIFMNFHKYPLERQPVPAEPAANNVVNGYLLYQIAVDLQIKAYRVISGTPWP